MGRRKPWTVSFRSSEGQRAHDPSPSAAESGQRPCARGEWCHGRAVTTADGQPVITPALAYRPFCDTCQRYLADCLAALPAGYLALEAELGEPSRTGDAVHVPAGPRLPLREEVDALMRLTAVTLCGWEARVRASARLSRPDPRAPIDTSEAVRRAAGTIGGNLSVLMALEPAWTTRTVDLPPARRSHTTATAEPLHKLATRDSPAQRGYDAEMAQRETGELVEQLREYADDDFVQIGVDFVKVGCWLDGAAAGLEILRLHHRARAVLGEVGGHPDTLDGVPCRNPECEDMALERAEPPSDPSLPAMYSRCASCGAQMSREDFAAWAAMYAAWADDSGLTCRRCACGKCAECRYSRCSCACRGHKAAA